jgi:hypothetical protein
VSEENDLTTMDDRQFHEIREKWLAGSEGRQLPDSGLDVDLALELGKAGKKDFQSLLAGVLDALPTAEWLAYQFLPHETFPPILMLQLRALGVARLSTTGQPVFTNTLLFTVPILANGRADIAEVHCLVGLTPLWHPQVASADGRCALLVDEVGSWQALVESLRALISYDGYDTQQDVLNVEAARWVAANPALFPLKQESPATDW